MLSRHFFAIVALLISLSVVLDARAAISNAFLSVDFQPSLAGATETGFQAYAGPQSYSTTEGNLAVSDNTGQYFDRGVPTDSGSFTYGELYRDFNYTNGAGAGINYVLSGTAIHPGIQYQITWYAYDFNAISGTTVTFSPTALSNTAGSTGSVTYPAGGSGVPTSDNQYSFTGIWTATDNSLEITALADPGNPRVNGFEIVALPEPSVGICALAGGIMFVCRRARRSR
jgi:hypothetical protein